MPSVRRVKSYAPMSLEMLSKVHRYKRPAGDD